VLSLERYTTVQASRGCPWPCVFCDIPIFNEGKWRARSPEHVVAELKQLEEDGYGTVFFVDDQFLLRPKRIEAMCKGINDNNLSIFWGCEGRVDSKCMEVFPAMAKANCRTLMFGIESGSQKILDRLKKEQTLEEIETAVNNAKQAGIEIVHGFFVVGNPDETVEDIRMTFDFASRLRIDSFGFNRLCVYRGTPLWQEYVRRGLVDDVKDWYKYYKCSSVDPTVLSGEEIHAARSAGIKKLIIYKLTRYPLQSFRLLRRFTRYMPLRDVLHLLIKPFLGDKKGATKAELLSRAVEHGDMKTAAADLTQLPDEALEQAMRETEPPPTSKAANQ
jgi:anaerobic magnesium-protoporphyrin IX monomethyl ester cyclase